MSQAELEVAILSLYDTQLHPVSFNPELGPVLQDNLEYLFGLMLGHAEGLSVLSVLPRLQKLLFEELNEVWPKLYGLDTVLTALVVVALVSSRLVWAAAFRRKFLPAVARSPAGLSIVV